MTDIQADDRESGSGILNIMQAHPQINLDIRRMPYGDYIIDKWLIVERKQISDLIVSIVDGRLFQQAERLCQSAYTPLLIIEGQGHDIKDSKMDRRAILGALASIGLLYGICVLRAINKEETLNVILYAARQKARIEKAVIGRRGYRPRSFKKRQSFILQGLPNVGPTLAKALLQHFGNIRSVMTANRDQLQKISGVGPKKAEQIVSLLTKQI